MYLYSMYESELCQIQGDQFFDTEKEKWGKYFHLEGVVGRGWGGERGKPHFHDKTQ